MSGELEEQVVIDRVGDAIAEAAAAERRALLAEDARRAARRAAVEIASAVLSANNAATAAHSDDVDVISEAIGRRLGLSEQAVDDMIVAARLHDIGKLGVPQRIIEKPAALDHDEWAVIRRHTIIGEQILVAVPELRGAAHLVRHSHERWDGAGYPDGLAGEEIPLGSRIVFCADAYHAIRSDRPYRQGRSAAEALAEIRSCAGTQFDPKVVEALEALAGDLRKERNGNRQRPIRYRRLTALMLIVSIGACSSALARSGLIEAKTPDSGPASAAALSPPGATSTAVGANVAAGAFGNDSANAGEGAASGTLSLFASPPTKLMIPPGLLSGVPGLGVPATPGEQGPADGSAAPGVRDHGRGIGRGKGQGKGRGAEMGRGHQKTKKSKVHGSGRTNSRRGTATASKAKGHRAATGNAAIPKPKNTGGGSAASTKPAKPASPQQNVTPTAPKPAKPSKPAPTTETPPAPPAETGDSSASGSGTPSPGAAAGSGSNGNGQG